MRQRDISVVESALLSLNDNSSYEKRNLNLYVGKEYDNGFEIDYNTAVSIVKSEEPSMLRGSTTSFTIDTVGNTTMLFAKNAEGIVEYTVKLESTEHRTVAEDFDFDEMVAERASKAAKYKRLSLCVYILSGAVITSVFISVYLIHSIVRW